MSRVVIQENPRHYAQQKSEPSEELCFGCGQPGHRVMECPERACYECGEFDHFANMCPHRTRKQPAAQPYVSTYDRRREEYFAQKNRPMETSPYRGKDYNTQYTPRYSRGGGQPQYTSRPYRGQGGYRGPNRFQNPAPRPIEYPRQNPDRQVAVYGRRNEGQNMPNEGPRNARPISQARSDDVRNMGTNRTREESFLG